MKLASGIDLIEVERVQAAIQRHGGRFLERVYTPTEQSDCQGRVESLAARFAAKEAVAKALGCGIGAVTWREIEVRRGLSGQPELHLSGAAACRAVELGLLVWSVSLSHTRTHATAIVVALGGE